MRGVAFIGLLLASAAAVTGTANAAITVHTSQATFLAAITNAGTGTFNDLSQTLYNSPLNRTAGSFGYQVTATNGLYPGNTGGNVFMSTNTATETLGFVNFTGGANAIGGRFFSSNIAGLFTSSPQITLTFTDSAGSVAEVILNPQVNSFRGFTTTATMTSLTVTGFNPAGTSSFYWPSVDDLTLGNFGVVPEPSSWALMLAGFGLVGVALRRRTSLTAA